MAADKKRGGGGGGEAEREEGTRRRRYKSHRLAGSWKEEPAGTSGSWEEGTETKKGAEINAEA